MLRGRGGDDQLRVGFRGDMTDLGLNTTARLTGGDGNDQLFGGINTNQLVGGGGDDAVASFGRLDRLSGGAGADVLAIAGDFGARETRDVVTDFVRGEDQLFIQGLRFGDLDANEDGVLDDQVILGTGDRVVIGEATVDGVTRLSTTLIIAQFTPAPAVGPQGGVLVVQSTVLLFGVTGLTADDFFTTGTM